jgi:hypothetical protein
MLLGGVWKREGYSPRWVKIFSFYGTEKGISKLAVK